MAITAITSTDFASAQMDGQVVVWSAIINGNQGAAYAGDWQTASFQVGGTFGAGGSIRLEGSNDGVTFFALTPTALTAAGLFTGLGVTERPKYIRPSVTAGDGTTALNVTAFFGKKRLGVT